jgi:hypothetical protein
MNAANNTRAASPQKKTTTTSTAAAASASGVHSPLFDVAHPDNAALSDGVRATLTQVRIVNFCAFICGFYVYFVYLCHCNAALSDGMRATLTQVRLCYVLLLCISFIKLHQSNA